MIDNQEKVLVTGASGYIALHCISELIKNNYKVKASLRDLSRVNEVTTALKNEDIEFCQLDLLNDNGWEEAASDCDYILHIASPFKIEEPKNEDSFIKPALEGTLRALKAAKKASVKKIVLTSSMASIAYGHNKKVCNKDDWTDITKDVGAYIKSKTIAEKAAWNFIKEQDENQLVMTTIHPGMVFGPLLSDDKDGASASLIMNMINGKFPAIPDVFFTVVDVRDIAKLHIQSLKNTNSDNKRIIATSQNGISFLKISEILRELGYIKSPTALIPNQVINSMAPFNKEMRNTAAMIKRGCYGSDVEETRQIYNWIPIPLKKTLKDMTDSLKVS